MIEFETGDTVLLKLTLKDGNATKFPTAEIYTSGGAPEGSAIALSHVSGGMYQGTVAAPTNGFYSILYQVYDDVGHTTLSTYEIGCEDLRVSSVGDTNIQLLRYGGAVHIDPGSPYSGTAFPMGTEEFPVNNQADAISIATTNNINRFHTRRLLTLSQAYPDWTFVGEGEEAVVQLNGQDVADSEFFNCRVEGTLGNGPIGLTNCDIQDIDDFEGTATECGIETGEITFVGTSSFIRCHSKVPGLSTPIFNLNGSGYNLEFRAYSGGINLRGFVDAGDKVSIDMIAGQIILDSSNTAGTAALRGVGKLTDNSGAGFIVDRIALLPNNLPLVIDIADAVWDEDITAHLADNTAGEAAFLSAKKHTRSDLLTVETHSGVKRPKTGRTRYFTSEAAAEASTSGATGEGEAKTQDMDASHVDVQQWLTTLVRGG